MMFQDLILAVDVGTSVVKAVLFDKSGQVVAKSAEPVDVRYRSNKAELDMEEVWQAVRRVMKCCSSHVPKGAVAAIGVTGQGDGCWLIDDEGCPTGPAILWNDGRANDLVQHWERDGTARKIFNINQSTLFPGSQAAILRWLDVHEPDRLQRSRWALYCKDWIFYRLTGVVQTEFTDASHPFLNIENVEYSFKTLEYLGISHLKHLLPPISSTGSGFLNADVANDLGLQAELPVVAGPFDVVAAMIGIGVNRSGVGGTVLGTTVVNALVLESLPKTPAYSGMTLYMAPNKWLRVMAVMLGTPNLDWVLNNIAAKRFTDPLSVTEYLREVWEETEPGAGGIIYHPYLSPSGERAPFVKPTARAQFHGLSIQHRTADLVRAVLEGVAFSIRDAYEEIGTELQEIRLTGGGAQSDVWCQIIADVTGREVVTFESSEAGALGVAIRTATELGLYSDIQTATSAMVHEKARFHPDPTRFASYSKRFTIYREIYHALWEVWDKNAEIEKTGSESVGDSSFPG